MNHYLDNSMDWISWENLRRKLGNSPSDGGACEYRESCTFSLNQPSEIWKITGFDPRPTVDLIAIDRVV